MLKGMDEASVLKLAEKYEDEEEEEEEQKESVEETVDTARIRIFISRDRS